MAENLGLTFRSMPLLALVLTAPVALVFLIARKLRDHIERYRLYGSAAISSVGCHAVHVWIRDHRIDIDAHY